MKALILSLLLMGTALRAAAPAPSAGPKRAWASEAAVALKQDPPAVLAILKDWKAAGGLKDPQYWQAGAYACLALSQAQPQPLSPSAASALSPTAEPEEPRPDAALLARGIAYLEGGAKIAPQRLDFFEDRIRFARLAEDLEAERKALESFLKEPRPKSGRYEREAGAFLKVTLAEHQIEFIKALAQEHFDDGEEQAGEQAARALVRAFPRKSVGQRLMAAHAAAKANVAGQVYWLEQALELDPDDPELWFEKGACLQDSGRKEEARQALQKALELGGEPSLIDRANERLELLK